MALPFLITQRVNLISQMSTIRTSLDGWRRILKAGHEGGLNGSIGYRKIEPGSPEDLALEAESARVTNTIKAIDALLDTTADNLIAKYGVAPPRGM